MAGGGVSRNIYGVFKNRPGRGRSGCDLLHLRDGFEIEMNFDRNVSCLIAVYEPHPQDHIPESGSGSPAH